MSVVNDFINFATGGSANVESQATYIADSSRVNGNQPGVASSALNNKALRQGTFVASNLAQLVATQLQANVTDNGVNAQFLAQLQAAIIALPPVISVLSYTGSSLDYNVPFIFFTVSANATAGATYGNNASVFTIINTVSAGLQLVGFGGSPPASSGTLTKLSGTGDATIVFYAFRAPLTLNIRMVGGGGGGSGSGTGSFSGGSNGGNTVFGSFTAGGGNGGSPSSGGGEGGDGGTITLGGTYLSAIGIHGSGGGSSGQSSGTNPQYNGGGSGGSSPFGGGGFGGNFGSNSGGQGAANSGSGGGGGWGNAVNSFVAGAGGGAGGYIEAEILVASIWSFAYQVGGAGAAGPAGGSGFVGSQGGTGLITVAARFQ